MERNRDAANASPVPEQHDPAAAESLFPLLNGELRRIAHRQLAVERAGHTLCTTALVHEAYVKLAAQTHAQFASRAHFLAVAAQAMRRILVTTRGRSTPTSAADSGSGSISIRWASRSRNARKRSSSSTARSID